MKQKNIKQLSEKEFLERLENQENNLKIEKEKMQILQ